MATKFTVHRPAGSPKEPMAPIANLTLTPSAADYNALLAVLRAWGLIKP